MAARKFKFVSPGVFLKEIDNSNLPKLPGNVGPVIVGRSRKGPALKAVKVDSYADFVDIFGTPIPGNQGDDVWREGNGKLATAYASYAAKAYFAADIQSPVTMVRLLGVQGDEAVGDTGAAGWAMNNAWGMFIHPSASAPTVDDTAAIPMSGSHLAAIFYGEKDAKFVLSGADLSGSAVSSATAFARADNNKYAIIKAEQDKTYQLSIKNSADTTMSYNISFNSGRDFIRNVLNTNPVASNASLIDPPSGSMAGCYWLGETFEQSAAQAVSFTKGDGTIGTARGSAFIVPLTTAHNTIKMADFSHEMAAARTGWVFQQDSSGQPATYDPEKMNKLFRFIALHEGEEASKEVIVGIEDIKVPSASSVNPYGSFTVTVKKIHGTRVEVIESFPGCNLNPSSQNYVARQVGDQYVSYSRTEKRNKFFGNHPNRSRFVRIEMDPGVDQQGPEDSRAVPFGFFGPIVPKSIDAKVARATGIMTSPADVWVPLGEPASSGPQVRFPKNSYIGSKATAKLHWPAQEQVLSGSSRGVDPFGVSVFKVKEDGSLTDEIDPGYIDYIRKMPTGYTADQIKGIKSNTTQYAYVCSLDNVAVEGSDLNDSSLARISAVYHKEGQRNARKAAGTISITNNQLSNYDDVTIKITAFDGTEETFEFDQDGGGDDADNVANGARNGAGHISVWLQEDGENGDDHASNPSHMAKLFKAAIEASASKISGKVTASASAGTVTITQNSAGTAGNTEVSTSVRTQATATITTVAEGALVDTKDFRLTDANNVTTRYNVSTGLAIAGNTDAYVPGGSDGKGPADTITIGFNGATSQADVRDQIIARINAGTGIGFTASASGNNVLVTQNVVGTVGETDIDEPDGDTGLTFPAKFTGGGTAGRLSFTPLAGTETDLSIQSGTKSSFAGGSGTPGGTESYTSKFSAQGVEGLLELGFDKFQMPLVGGFDGVDVREADPFANRLLSDKTAANSYAYASVDRAVELLRDPEAVEYNLACMPGVTEASLTTKLVQACEARADALAIIDLPDVFKPPHELKTSDFSARIQNGGPTKSAKALKNRALNSSYGCAYYPWVKINDSENSRDIWAPPSIVALGVFGFTEQRDEVWFAPAGFNRGGLNEGNAGVPVLQVSEHLLSKQRDTLYEANINPIASFVTEGLVVFGQKTLQSTQSALDRINVRRLLIYVKKEISRIASGLLFDQNVPATWNRFLGKVNPFLSSVKTRLGLADYKIILDESTTTPDLVDRNIMYAKIFLKPARAIEFIAVDFVITSSGASFED